MPDRKLPHMSIVGGPAGPDPEKRLPQGGRLTLIRREPGLKPAVLLAYGLSGQRAHLSKTLEEHGCNVVCCSTGRESLRRLVDVPVDLLVTGILMQDVDGLELISTLNRRRPKLPVIAVCEGDGKMDRIYMRSAMLFGAVSAHPFPLAPASFLAAVEQALEKGVDARMGI